MILGIRTSPTTVRYAVLDCNGTTVSLVNAESENRLDFPADCRSIVLRQYPGCWTCDPSGGFVEHNANYEFRFEEQPKEAKLFDFTAFKKNKATGRETRVGEYSMKNVHRKQSDEAKRNFMQWVVTG